MDSHPNIVHLDELETVRTDRGDRRSVRSHVAAAAGATRIGLSHWHLDPGGRSTPPHSHGDEEEIFYVLAGSGLSWQDGRTYAIGAGDCLVHPVRGAAHTLIAGDDGLEVLAFAEGSESDLTWMPRTQMFWAAGRWIPGDAPHPFAADDALGPLEVPAPEASRPPTIVHHDDVERDEDLSEGYRGAERRLGRAAGATRSGLRHVELEARQASCPPHWHLAEEELFVILDGAGEAWLDGARFALRTGSVFVRPPGTKVAHAMEAGPGGMTYLSYGQHRELEVCFYPRSNILNVGGLTFRVQPVPYADGEPAGLD